MGALRKWGQFCDWVSQYISSIEKWGESYPWWGSDRSPYWSGKGDVQYSVSFSQWPCFGLYLGKIMQWHVSSHFAMISEWPCLMLMACEIGFVQQEEITVQISRSVSSLWWHRELTRTVRPVPGLQEPLFSSPPLLEKYRFEIRKPVIPSVSALTNSVIMGKWLILFRFNFLPRTYLSEHSMR